MPKVYGWEHILYLVISAAVSVLVCVISKKYAKTEKAQTIALKSVAAALLASVITNRISIATKYGGVDWWKLIPDSFCGTSSFVLSIATLAGKKDNSALQFVWFLAALGGMLTIFYPTFVSQSDSLFYLPTISGLLHHSISILLVVMLFLFKYIHVTYKRWYCIPLGFTCYLTVGLFLLTFVGYKDAFHIYEPLLSGTPLDVWFVAPIYVGGYALILLGFELVRKLKAKKAA